MKKLKYIMNFHSVNANVIRQRFLTLVLILAGLIYWRLTVRKPAATGLSIFLWEHPGNDISCHSIEEGNALPPAEGMFSPKENSIFFHETSCRGGLNSRQACAVESAARLHPTREVHLLFSSPIDEKVVRHSCIAKLMTYPNIKLSRVHIARYAKGTPLESMVNSDRLGESNWQVEHTSDVLRYITLYKYGGVYLDTDTLTVRPFDDLGGNWVGVEDKVWVNPAVIGISNDNLGRRIIDELVRELNNTFNPKKWNHNGPGTLTRVLHRMCNITELERWNTESCQGFPVYGPEYFYPIHYNSYKRYFTPGEEINADKAYTHHFWNKLSKNMTVVKDSPYAIMARKYCPEVYDMYEEKFGQ